MIWSFVQPDKNDYHYYETAYTYLGYFAKGDGVWFVRQPAENHVEYNYVNMMYQHWKASGDEVWMKLNLSCAMKALDYCVTDTLKWSKRFQLLKRPYCIDSWDFQVNDEYTPPAPLSPTMVVVPGKTKFGIFFGDNTGYYDACLQLGEMLEHAGRMTEAQIYRKRGKEILDRIIKLSWNGRYFTHFIDEDPTVKRNLGVDEKSQIAQGNDMRGLPVGIQEFNLTKFKVTEPEKNSRKAVIGLSYARDFPRSVEVPVNENAACVNLLHSSSDNTPSEFAGAITFRYADGSEKSRNIVKFRDVTNWWFSKLENDRAGVAWAGPNPVSTRVCVCWAAIDNPEPEKKIEKLIFHAPIEGGIYAVIGITLSDKPYYLKPKFVSFGGPDNWAAANGMAALVEGLAGVKNTGLAFDKVRLSPRWCSAATDSADVEITFPASGGYISYRYAHHPASREIRLILTGSGRELNAHVLLPESVKQVRAVSCNGKTIQFKVSLMEESKYADFDVDMNGVKEFLIKYE